MPSHSTPLTQSQVKQLRALGHQLKPLVLVGQAGITQGLIDELSSTLEHHELVKVRLSGAEREERDAMAKTLSEQTSSSIIQRIGHMVLLFRRNPKKTKITLTV
jgi:RNA-binding protein